MAPATIPTSSSLEPVIVAAQHAVDSPPTATGPTQGLPRTHPAADAGRFEEAAALLVLRDAADAAIGGREGRRMVSWWATYARSVRGLLDGDLTGLNSRHERVVRPVLARVRPGRLGRYQRELERLAADGIEVRTCRQEPPAPVLTGFAEPLTYTRGPLTTVNDAVIAMLGDPDARAVDQHMAATIARDLTQHGLTVLTGWRSRTDRAAAWAALEAGGRPILLADRGLAHVTTEDALVGAVIAAGGLVASTAPPGAQYWPDWWRHALVWAHGLVPTTGTDYEVAHLAVRASLDRHSKVGPQHCAIPCHLEAAGGWPSQLVGEVASAQVADWLDPTDPAAVPRLRYWARVAHGWRDPTLQRHALDAAEDDAT